MASVVIDVSGDFQSKMLLACLAIQAGGSFPVVARHVCSPSALAKSLGWTETRVKAVLLECIKRKDIEVSRDRRSVTIATRRVRYEADRRSKGQSLQPTEQEQALFSVWRRGMNKSHNTKFSQARIKALRKALAPEPNGYGFTAETLLRSIRGWVEYCNEDPWRLERLNRHDLTLIVRTVEHIEEGLQVQLSDGLSEGELAMQEASRRG